MTWQTIVKFTRQLWDSLRIRPRTNASAQAQIQRKVSEIVDLLQREDWGALHLHFSPLIRWFLPESLFRTGFTALRLTTGPIVHIGSPIISHGWLTTTAKLPIQFKNLTLALVLHMTANNRVLGLKFWPQRLHGFGSPWQSPLYAADSANEWEETSVKLGSSDLKVPGILTIPRKPGRYPCIVMLSGSGPCDRDSSVEAAKPFKDLALGLASLLNIATLRYDKVTLTHGSRVRGEKSFTLTEEYMDHAESAVRYCQSHEKLLRSGVFVLGHSLGGYVAPRLAERMEHAVAGCILLATPAGPLYWSALRQLEYLATGRDFPPAGEESGTTAPSQHIEELRRAAQLADGPDLKLSTPASELPFGIGPAYWLDFRNYTPIQTCKRLGKPILIAQGGRDYQVTVKDDYDEWCRRLEDTSDVTFRFYDHLNHLFIFGSGPSTPLEYDVPGNVDVQVVRDIGEWVLANSINLKQS